MSSGVALNFFHAPVRELHMNTSAIRFGSYECSESLSLWEEEEGQTEGGASGSLRSAVVALSS